MTDNTNTLAPVKKSQKTKQLIEETFVSLLDNNDYNRIGVRELTQAAGINRNTFYYYYKNIPDLIESIVKSFVDDTLAKHPPTYNSFEDCLLAAINMALAHKQSVYHIYNSANRAVFERYLWKICNYTVTSYVNTIRPVSLQVTDKEREILITMLKYECFGFVMDWIMHGMPDSVLEGIRTLNAAIKHQQSFLYPSSPEEQN